jgi:NDP-sugar pyrophosphorylase family protein
MVRVAGRPFLEHVLELLAEQGVRRVVVLRGHLGGAIEEGLGDGRRFGLAIDYSDEGPEPIGTAEALRRALPLLGDRFLVTYGDTYLRVDPLAVAARHARSGLPGLMTVLRNRGRWDTSNVVYRDGLVRAYDKHSPPARAEWIDYGMLSLTPEALEDRGESDLADVLSRLAAAGRLAGMPVRRRFYEIGTAEALAETERFLTRARPGSGSPGA